MTDQEQALADQKMRAEIAKLIAETSKINTENRYSLLIAGAAFATALFALGRLIA